jgi:hypothetical protein
MRTLHAVVGLMSLVLLASGCPKKGPETKAEKKQTAPEKPGGLPADSEYASGNVPAVVMEVQTRLDVDMVPEGKVDEEVKKAQAASVTTQTMTVSDQRGKLVFTTEDFYVPKGTELRYNPASRKYVLADAAKKQYWAMTGGEIGNLLEGGPSMTRSHYDIKISDTQDKETIAGYEAHRSDALLSFDWAIKTRSGEKKGKVKVKLAIWHSGDARLKETWGDTMVDFLTVPFQDEGGQKVVGALKSKLKFPLKWAMEVENEGQGREKGDQPPRLVTVAQKLDIKDMPRAELASPPAGFEVATGPYEFGEGGQTAKEELLGKLPARKGAPPEGVPPPAKK